MPQRRPAAALAGGVSSSIASQDGSSTPFEISIVLDLRETVQYLVKTLADRYNRIEDQPGGAAGGILPVATAQGKR